MKEELTQLGQDLLVKAFKMVEEANNTPLTIINGLETRCYLRGMAEAYQQAAGVIGEFVKRHD